VLTSSAGESEASLINPVSLRKRRSPAAKRYEVNKPTTLRETMLLKAVADPMLIKASRQNITVVTATDHIGTDVRAFTFHYSQKIQETESSGRVEIVRTLCKVFQPGRPRSRAKDQNIREVDASKPTVEHSASVVKIAAMTALPATE
jgi:hypothetical protein